MVLMKNDLRDVITGIDLSSKTFQRIIINFVWACVFNVLGSLIMTVHMIVPPSLRRFAR